MRARFIARPGIKTMGVALAVVVVAGIAAQGAYVEAGTPNVPSQSTGPGSPNLSPSKLAQGGPSVTLEWYWAVFGSFIGHTGMFIGDLDADHHLEMVTTAQTPSVSQGDHYWYVVKHDGSGYRMIHAEFPYEEEIRGLTAAHLPSSDRSMDILVVLDGRILVYDSRHFGLEAERSISPSNVRGFAVADIDGDFTNEAVLCNGDATWAYDLKTWAQQLYVPGPGCLDLAVGETDGSAGLEIVLANGNGAGQVLDAVTGSVEWNHPTGFGEIVAVGDLDGDQVDEIIAGFDEEIQAWNGDSRDLVWVKTVESLDNVITGDVEGDGSTDVVYGDPWSLDLVVLDGANGVPKWSVQNPDDGFSGIAIGDLDGDGTRDIFFGAGYSSTDEDHLHVVDTVTHTRVWQSEEIVGPFSGFVSGDVDADGELELVYTSAESSHYFIHDASTKEPEYQSPQFWENWVGMWDVALAHSDGDARLEILLPTSDFYDGLLHCRDGVTQDVQWEVALQGSSDFGSVVVADPDRDGTHEVATVLNEHNSGPNGAFVCLYDVETGAEEWRSVDLGPTIGSVNWLSLVRVSDIDNDDIDEIVVAGVLRDLAAVDPVNDSVDLITAGLSLRSLATADLDYDGAAEVVIGTAGGLLQVIERTTGAPITIGGPYVDTIDGLAVVDLSGDGIHDYVFAASDRVHIVDGATMLPVWVSEDIGEDVGRHDGVVVADFDSDGRKEIWVNAGKIGHAMFEVALPGSLVFQDGFENGDTSAWSETYP